MRCHVLEKKGGIGTRFTGTLQFLWSSEASCEVQPNVRGAKWPTAEDAMGRRPGARLVEGALTGGNRVGANGRPADRTPLGL
jgi:hypothetical protein